MRCLASFIITSRDKIEMAVSESAVSATSERKKSSNNVDPRYNDPQNSMIILEIKVEGFFF